MNETSKLNKEKVDCSQCACSYCERNKNGCKGCDGCSKERIIPDCKRFR